MLKEFFRRVWGDSEGWAVIGSRKANTGSPKFEEYRYPEQLDLLVREVEEKIQRENLFFCPHLCKERGTKEQHVLKKPNASPPKVVWADKDSGLYSDFKPYPTFCWETSPGKFQALWVLTEHGEPRIVEQASKRIVYTSDADKATWNLGRLLRIPTTLNFKYTPPAQGVLLWDNGPEYDLEDLLPDQETLDQEVEAELSMPKTFPSSAETYMKYGNKISIEAWGLLNRGPEGETDWSETLWKLERRLIESGIPLEHVFTIVRDAPWNKFERDNLGDEALWKDLVRAVQKKGKPDRPEGLPWNTLDELLEFDQRPQWLVQDIWMEKNVGWIAGVGKSYKSVISLDLALSVATGEPFLGKFPVIDPGPVLMVQEEDPKWRVAHRLQAMAKTKGIDTIKVEDKEGGFVLKSQKTGTPLFVSIGAGVTFKDEEKTRAVEIAIEYYRPRIVIMDPMFMLSAGIDEFKSSEISQILIQLKDWRNRYDCAIAIVHHYRKGGGDAVERIYGSMAMYAWSENSLLVGRKRGTNTSIIQTDVKDAPSSQKIEVEFLDIDKNYEVIVGYAVDEDEKLDSPLVKIKAYLQSGKMEQSYTLQDLVKVTGMSERSVRKHIKMLEEKNLIIKDSKGTGGKLSIKPTAQLFEAVDVEVSFDEIIP